MAKLLDLTPRRLQQLAAEGVIPKEERGRYNPFRATVAYIRYLRDRKESSGVESSGHEAEKLRKTKEEADKLALANAKERGELVETKFVVALVQGIAVVHRQKILSSTILTDDEKDDWLRDLKDYFDAGSVTKQLCRT